jgi:hypothetical protein
VSGQLRTAWNEGLRFVGGDTIELDFEGVGTPDRTFVARREQYANALLEANHTMASYS